MFGFFPFPPMQRCKVCGYEAHINTLVGTSVFDGTKEIFDGFVHNEKNHVLCLLGQLLKDSPNANEAEPNEEEWYDDGYFDAVGDYYEKEV